MLIAAENVMDFLVHFLCKYLPLFLKKKKTPIQCNTKYSEIRHIDLCVSFSVASGSGSPYREAKCFGSFSHQFNVES